MASSSDAAATALADDGLSPEDAATIDARARLRLLQLLASRGSTELAAFLIPPAFLALYAHGGSTPIWPLALWWIGMMCFASAMLWMRHRLKRDWDVLATRADPVPTAAALDGWQRIFSAYAATSGMMWSLLLLCSWEGATYEFRVVVYLVFCGVLASATTFLAPIPAVFWSFAITFYLPMLLAAHWYLPQQGIFMVVLLLLYGMTVARHAFASRRFVRQQHAQERERHALAVQIHGAKVQAENALAEKNWFLSAASHDLRQPLQALGFMLETARMRNRDTGVAQALADVQACTRDLDMMFNDLLDLSRLESGTLELRMQPVPIGMVLLDARRMFAPVAEQQGVELRVMLPRRADAAVHTDLSLMRQMVFNLVHNALRYTSEGSVTLTCRRRQGAWRIQVWDTGIGIGADELDKVFAAHYKASNGERVQDSLGGKASGSARASGLGLAVVARSAQRLGVRYGVQSRLGRGSCFWLQWPADADVGESAFQASLLPMQDAGAALDAAPVRARLLLLDANEPRSAETARLLRGLGLDVRVARSAMHAVADFDQHGAPDALLCADSLVDHADVIFALERVLEHAPGVTGALLTNDAALQRRAEDEGYMVFALPLQPRALHAVLARIGGAGRTAR
ncbi:sensor histidine kinase [Diaphorobacter caeni]|uniref:sensor histidine kinase n=1 Tax=Diaphorobacter caeni TaxID=2784387 RepID=UPI00188E8750|nr:HAMP domain-containing sensor histidine kinase [Diaphorobacter caeni]MBF5004137.1 hybrid sensor histidine kinase/response regulator [Diaphorobacter caeni]